jgi:hypothetical protein
MGLKPWTKQIDAILGMDVPKNMEQTCSFLSAVTYYCEIWAKMLIHFNTPHIIDRQRKVPWEDQYQQAFEQMKALMALDTLSLPTPSTTYHSKFIWM